MTIEEFAFKKGYRVNKQGKMFNAYGKEICINSVKKYKQTNIFFKGVRKRLTVHRLQAFQKYGNKMYEKGIVVRHKNNNSQDNSYDNILIGTNKQNSLDVPKEDRVKRAKYASSFSKKHDHESIIKHYKKVESYSKTMKKFNISSKGTLHYILNKKTS